MKKNDLFLMGEAYGEMLQEAIITYSAKHAKISLIKSPKTGKYIIEWYDIVDGGSPKNNEEKSYQTDDRNDAIHTFEKIKSEIIKGSVHENLNKPNAFIRRNVQSPVTHPFILMVEKDCYPCTSVDQAKKLAGILRVRAAVQV